MTENMVLSSEVPMGDSRKYSIKTYFMVDNATMIAEYRTSVFEQNKPVCEFFTKSNSPIDGTEAHCRVVKQVALSNIDQLVHEYSKQPQRLTVKVCVAGQNDEGPKLFFVKVYCDEDQLDNGDHYEAAKEWVKKAFPRSEPVWACDEYDPADEVMELAPWFTVETIRVTPRKPIN